MYPSIHVSKYAWYPSIQLSRYPKKISIQDIHVSGYQKKVVSTHPYLVAQTWEGKACHYLTPNISYNLGYVKAQLKLPLYCRATISN